MTCVSSSPQNAMGRTCAGSRGGNLMAPYLFEQGVKVIAEAAGIALSDLGPFFTERRGSVIRGTVSPSLRIQRDQRDTFQVRGRITSGVARARQTSKISDLAGRLLATRASMKSLVPGRTPRDVYPRDWRWGTLSVRRAARQRWNVRRRIFRYRGLGVFDSDVLGDRQRKQTSCEPELYHRPENVFSNFD